jgi:uncharacterized protein YjiK
MNREAFRKTLIACALISSLAVALIILACCTTRSPRTDSAASGLSPYQWLGNIDKSQFKEPSGMCFHLTRGTLFVVGDRGDVCEIRTDGTLIKQERIRRADFEGITHDPSSGLLYIAVEGEEKILEVSPDDFQVLREFQIPRTFQGRTLLAAGGQGIEAIAFVPDERLAHGGTFFVANQSSSLDNAEDISAIFEVEVPLKAEEEPDHEVRILNYFALGVVDLSGLYFDEPTGHLFVISDSENAIIELTREGTVLTVLAFPGDDQEGIAADDAGFMYMCQDSGGIIKLKWERKRQAPPTE